jgi:hypothetical protein
MLITILLIIVGYRGWGLIEYGIHGLLSHRWKTFVSPLHWGHHEVIGNVFTPPIISLPLSFLAWGLLCLLMGIDWGSALSIGWFSGFLRYEYVHWRMHYREPVTPRQRFLRAHHFAHHFCNHKAYFGVTTRFWDQIFNSLPEQWRDDYRRVEHILSIDTKS